MELSRKRLFSRRELFLGVGALVAGVIGGIAVNEIAMYKPPLEPLTPPQGDAQSTLVISWLPDTVKRWTPELEHYSKKYKLDPNLAAIIMTIESGGNPKANSGVAEGLMQITKPRAKDIAEKFLLKPRTKYNLYDPDTSIEFGVANIRHLVDEFGDSTQGPAWDKTVSLVAAGYYGGEGAAITYRDKGFGGIKDQGTFSYIRFVTNMWRERHDPKSFAYYYWYHTGKGEKLIKEAEKIKK